MHRLGFASLDTMPGKALDWGIGGMPSRGNYVHAYRFAVSVCRYSCSAINRFHTLRFHPGL